MSSPTKMYVASAQAPPWNTWTRTQKSITYDAIKAAGENGITREDVCKATGLPKQRVWFYLSELRRGGLIKRMGDAIDPTQLSPSDAKLYAINALEGALVANATDHLRVCTTCKLARNDDSKRCELYKGWMKGFVRYSKIKSLALGAKTGGEEHAALRAAVIDLIKLVF